MVFIFLQKRTSFERVVMRMGKGISVSLVVVLLVSFFMVALLAASSNFMVYGKPQVKEKWKSQDLLGIDVAKADKNSKILEAPLPEGSDSFDDWSRTGTPGGGEGMVIGDVNNDGTYEVIYDGN